MTDQAAPPVLHLDQVRKSYGKVRALKGISLDISGSEVIGLLGPNGAGKSTLFQIAAGLFAPDGGTVELFGLDYRRHSAAILSRLGVVFQSRSLDLDMSVKANLAFHGGLFGLSGSMLRQRIEGVVELLEIGELVRKPVRTLSGGNQRRVEIARALLNQPDLLLMDEPSTGLDATTRRMLVAHMQVVREQHGTSILWATHLVEEVAHADRIVLIRAGEIIRQGSPAELMEAAGTTDLTDAYISLTGSAPGEARAEAGAPAT
jgi:ABC-2 type transport system ATP-binding protein